MENLNRTLAEKLLQTVKQQPYVLKGKTDNSILNNFNVFDQSWFKKNEYTYVGNKKNENQSNVHKTRKKMKFKKSPFFPHSTLVGL